MKSVLKNTPLATGNLIAWLVLAVSLSFAAGWIANAIRISGICYTVV